MSSQLGVELPETSRNSRVYPTQVSEGENMNMGFNLNWKKNGFKIFYLVSKFTFGLRKLGQQLKLRQISTQIQKVINDKASDVQFFGYQKKGKKRIIKEFNINEETDNWLILPGCTFKLIWDTLMLILTTLNLFYIPFKVAFPVENLANHWKYNLAFDITPGIFYIIEIPISLNTAYYSHGILIKNRDLIVRHYFKMSFLQDLIICVSFIASQFDVQILTILMLLRFTKMGHIFRSLEDTQVPQEWTLPFELFKLIFFLVFVGHLCSCAWRGLARLEIHYNLQNEMSVWFIEQQLQDQSIDTQYIYSFYWSIITLTTIGYGDIVPKNKYEMIFVSMLVLVTTILVGYVISCIQSIFANMKQKSDDFKYKMAILNRYIKTYNLSFHLSMKVRNYLEAYLRAHEKDDHDETEMVLDMFNDDLRNQIRTDIYGNVLNKSKFFTQTFDEKTVYKLCQEVKTQRCAPGEILFNQGECPGKLYFLIRGSISLFFDRGNMLIKELGPGTIIGQNSFIANRTMEYSAKATHFTELAYIDYPDFLKVIKQSSNHYERYNLVKSHIENTPMTSKQINCEACNQNHFFSNCPYLFYRPSKHKVLKIDRDLCKIHFRRTFKRKPFKSEGFKLDRKEFQQSALQIQIDTQLIQETEVDDNFLYKFGFYGISEELALANTRHEEIQVQDLKLANLQKRQTNISSRNIIQYKNEEERGLERSKVAFDIHDVHQDINPSLKKPIQRQIGERRNSARFEFDQMEQVQWEYIQLIKEDYLEGFEVKQDFRLFYPYFNLSKVISKCNNRDKIYHMNSRRLHPSIKKKSLFITDKNDMKHL